MHRRYESDIENGSPVLRFVGKRLLQAIPVLFGVIVLSFVLNRLLPGDPARLVTGDQVTEAELQRVREQMGLDQPLWLQFADYIVGLARGDLGMAYHTGRPVLEDLLQALPATLELALLAAIIAVVLAVPLGILAAVLLNTAIDYVVRIIVLIGASVPVFWMAIAVIQLTYVQLSIAPAPSGRLDIDLVEPTKTTGLFVLDALLSGDTVALASAWAHLIFPAFCLALGSLALLAQITRASMLDVLGQDYMRTARAKGLTPLRQIAKHGFKNAASPVINAFGMQLGYLVGGSLIIESVFAWPGIGDYLYRSILANDYAPVQALMVVSGVVFVGINIVVDALQMLIDRRIRVE